MAAAKTMRIGVFEQMRRGALQNSGLSDVIRGMFCGDPTMVMAYRDCRNQITLDEQAVWIAVIEQAAMDLCAPESSPKWRNAFAWIGTPDFSHVCDLAMLSPAGIARGLRLVAFRPRKTRKPAHCRGGRKSVSKAVRCVETGEVWPSFYLAEKSIGCSPGAIHNALRKNGKLKGRHFEEVVA